jgi:quercetin dioxygenase-like cupin family protein
MEIYKAGSRPGNPGNPDWFTGKVWQDPVIQAPDPARVRALLVSFDPGARTAWHTHRLGQTLHVLSGSGLVGLRGQAPRVIRPGDTVWIPPGEDHWHGAGPQTAMAHLAIQEALDGVQTDWLEQVSEADYTTAPETT